MLIFQKSPVINSACIDRATNGEYCSTFSCSSHIPACSKGVFTSHAGRHHINRQAHKNSNCGKVSARTQNSNNKVIIARMHEEVYKM
jgi:hypothetical protein